MSITNSPSFAPQLYISSGTKDIGFYTRAFNAEEQRRWTNEDGSIHVAELLISDAIFHLHESNEGSGLYAPTNFNGTTVLVGLFVADVDEVMKKAIAAGAVELSPAQDYEYGYRQGIIKDPFGHHWMIQQKI